MPIYMKAYALRELRRFPSWNESRWACWVQENRGRDSSLSELLADDDIVYLHETGIVSRDVFGDGDVIFDEISPEWTSFCRDVLEFRVPDWQEESKRAREDLLARLEVAKTDDPSADAQQTESRSKRDGMVNEFVRPSGRTSFDG
jgi:hypothetical protein